VTVEGINLQVTVQECFMGCSGLRCQVLVCVCVGMQRVQLADAITACEITSHSPHLHAHS